MVKVKPIGDAYVVKSPSGKTVVILGTRKKPAHEVARKYISKGYTVVAKGKSAKPISSKPRRKSSGGGGGGAPAPKPAPKKVSVVVVSKRGDYETFQNITPEALKELQTKYGYRVVKKVEGRAIKGSEVNKAISEDIGKIEVLEGGKPAILHYSKAQFKGKTPEEIVEEVNLRRQKEHSLESVYERIKTGKDVVVKTPSGEITTLRTAGLSGVSIKTLKKRGYEFISPEKVKYKEGKILVETTVKKKTEEITPAIREKVKLTSLEKKLAPFFGGYTPYFFGSGINKEEIAQEMLYSGQRTMTQKETERALKIQIKSALAAQEQEKAFERWGIAEKPGGAFFQELLKGIPRSIVRLPETAISTPIFMYQLGTRPVETVTAVVEEAKRSPGGFTGEFIGTTLALGIIGKGVKSIKGSIGRTKLATTGKDVAVKNIEAANLKTIKIGEDYSISSGKIKLKSEGLAKPIEGKVRIITKGDKAKMVIKIEKQKVGDVTVKPQEIIIGEKKLVELIRKGDIILRTKEKVVYPYEAKGLSLRAEKKIGVGESPYQSGLKTRIEKIGYKERGIISESPKRVTVETAGVVSKGEAYLVRESIIDMRLLKGSTIDIRQAGNNIAKDALSKLTGTKERAVKPSGGVVRSAIGRKIKIEAKAKPKPAIDTGNLGRIAGNIVRSSIASLLGTSARIREKKKRIGGLSIRMKRIAPAIAVAPVPLKRLSENIVNVYKSLGISSVKSLIPLKTTNQIQKVSQDIVQSTMTSLSEGTPLIKTTPTPVRKPPVKLRKKRIAPIPPIPTNLYLSGMERQINTSLKIIEHQMAKLSKLL